MANFDVQIQALVGTAEQTEMDQWMNDGTREITNLLPRHLKEYWYSKQTFTSAAANSEAETMITGQLGSVYAGSVECRQIRPMDKHKASTSTSIEYATATDPVYYIEGNKLNILPASSSGVYYVIANPNIDASAVSAIDNFPNEAEYLVILYAAIKVLQNKMNEYSISDLTINATPPILPSLTSISVSFSTTAPTYASQVVSPDFTDANTWLNTEEDSEMVASRMSVIQGQLQDHQSKIQNELNVFNKENIEYQAQLQKAIQDAQLASADDSQLLQKYQGEVQKYQADVGKEVQQYQQNFQKKVTQYTWYQGQQSKLQQDYNQGIQMLESGEKALQQQGGEK